MKINKCGNCKYFQKTAGKLGTCNQLKIISNYRFFPYEDINQESESVKNKTGKSGLPLVINYPEVKKYMLCDLYEEKNNHKFVSIFENIFFAPQKEQDKKLMVHINYYLSKDEYVTFACALFDVNSTKKEVVYDKLILYDTDNNDLFSKLDQSYKCKLFLAKIGKILKPLYSDYEIIFNYKMN